MNRNTLAGRRGGGAARSGSEGTDREGIDRDGEGGEAMPQGVPEAPRAFAAEAGAQRRLMLDDIAAGAYQRLSGNEHPKDKSPHHLFAGLRERVFERGSSRGSFERGA